MVKRGHVGHEFLDSLDERLVVECLVGHALVADFHVGVLEKVARFAGQALGLYGAGQAAGWIASVIGAIVLLAVVGMVRGRRRLM